MLDHALRVWVTGGELQMSQLRCCLVWPTSSGAWTKCVAAFLFASFLPAVSPAAATIDVYSASTNQLSIPAVLVGNTVYSNVVVTVDKVLQVGASPAGKAIDVYDPVSNQLFIPVVAVGAESYYNVAITVGNVLSVGGSSQPSGRFTLRNIRSYAYAIASGTWTSNINATIANSNADLVILNFGPQIPPLDRAAADPSGTKLIFGYYDVGESFQSQNPTLFAGSRPAWFGNPNPGWTGLYTVQYWDPSWLLQIYGNIDAMVAQGYDGIFLDVLSADSQWQSGNAYGNPVNPLATAQLGALVGSIRSYLATTYPNRKIYLVGNNPVGLARASPAALSNLDGIFNESAYYVNDTQSTSTYSAANVDHVAGMSSLYGSLGVPVIGHDYPPLSDPASIARTVDFYSALGWTSSVNNPTQSSDVMNTGPCLWMANGAYNAVVGAKACRNFIGGGLQASTTLVGGDLGDYFFGGPGQNVIQGGAGDDTIYAHPASASNRYGLVITYRATNKNSSVPRLTVYVNGAQVLTAQPMETSSDGTQTSRITVSLPENTTIQSLQLVGTNIDQIGCCYPTQYSNIQISSMTYQDQNIVLSSATWSNNISAVGLLNNNDTAVFSGLNIASKTFPSNTSDRIDGGSGSNVVVYRSNKSNYSVIRQADGSWRVSSQGTAEGPDILTNVQAIQFADQLQPLN
jgi:uncharacterized protein (TIGR01370 family)